MAFVFLVLLFPSNRLSGLCMCCAKVLQSCPTLRPYRLQAARLLCPWVSPGPAPGDFPNLGLESASLMSPALVGRFFTTTTTWEALEWLIKSQSFFSLAPPPSIN